MTVDEFKAEVQTWLTTAKHPRWNRPYTELAYQPMLEVLQYLRANGYKTYIVTGGGQDFARMGSEKVYGIPPKTLSEPLRQPSMATTRMAGRYSPRSQNSRCSTTLAVSRKAFT